MMPRWLRSLLVAALATGAAAFLFHVLPGWKAASRHREHGHADPRARSQEEHIEALSEAEKTQMLQELGGHV